MATGWMPTGPVWQSARMIPSPVAGSGFRVTRETRGMVVRRIRVVAIRSCICYIMVTFSDGSTANWGRDSGHSWWESTVMRARIFNFEVGEYITRLSLWGNGEGTRSGWIYFLTNRQREFNFGMHRTKRTEYPIDVQSGILVGLAGRSGLQIDGLAFVFLTLNAARNFNLGGVLYTPRLSAITTQDIFPQDHSIKNEEEEEELHWVFTTSREYTPPAYSWQLSLAAAMSEGLFAHIGNRITNVATAAIPKVVSPSPGSFTWDSSPTNSWSPTVAASSTGSGLVSNSISLTAQNHIMWCYLSGTLAPGDSISKRVVIGQGVLQSRDFSASIQSAANPGFQISVAGGCSGTSSSYVYAL